MGIHDSILQNVQFDLVAKTCTMICQQEDGQLFTLQFCDTVWFSCGIGCGCILSNLTLLDPSNIGIDRLEYFVANRKKHGELWFASNHSEIVSGISSYGGEALIVTKTPISEYTT